MDFRIASRYAKSLFDLATEQNQLDAVNEDFSDLLLSINQSPELTNLLKSPIVSLDKKEAVLQQAFGKDMNAISWAFIKIVLRKRRENQLPAIAEYFGILYKQKNGIATAQLITAIELSPELVQTITDKLVAETGKKISLTQKIDPKIIGGYIVNLEDRQIDASVATQIRNLRSQFDENLYVQDY